MLNLLQVGDLVEAIQYNFFVYDGLMDNFVNGRRARIDWGPGIQIDHGPVGHFRNDGPTHDQYVLVCWLVQSFRF